ncbi:BRCT domain-containing protein [Lasiodiplodia theobromae]|nr:BRCT domain-containing protein [Lasiodiplodia theobromae]
MTSAPPSALTHSSPPPQLASALDLSALPPIFVLPAHLAVDDLHELEDKITEHGGQITYNVSEASLVIGKVGTKRRAIMELRSRSFHTDDVTPESEPPAKRRKMENESFSVADLQRDTIKVIKMEWLDESSNAGRLLPLWNHLVYEGKPVPDDPSSSASRPKSRQTSGQSILERAKADAYPGTASTSEKKHWAHSKTALLQQNTSEYEGEPASDVPPPPEWAVRGIKYACQRSTPANSPNAAFIQQLKSIRLTRTLNGDEVGVRAYSTSIAAIAAYPHRIIHPKEILGLPGCDAKIANLWIEWKNSDEGVVSAVADAEKDETLKILRTFYDIWGVGAHTAREFLFERGWRDLDDVVEYGWSTLSRVQQIGVKYYDEFQQGIPRPEVEHIAAVVRDHAIRVRDERVEVIVVGGYRRGKDAPGDVDLIVSHRDFGATENLVTDLVASLERESWITHTLLLSLHNTQRGQSVLPYRATSTMVGPKGSGFDTLDKALVVWQDPDWPSKEADLARDPKAKNPNIHRRVDIIISPWRTIGCAVAGWSSGTTFQRDLRRYAKNVKGWKFDSSGGAIGCSVGYFLTRHPHFNPKIHSVVILEASEIAGGASGKAGGLVADWATPQCLAPLSFKLHGELAEKHGGHQRWGYRRVYCAEVDLQAQEHTANKPPPSEDSPNYPPELDWLQPASVKSYTEIGTPRNSAQVHPYLYTTSIARLAEEAGAIIRLGRATAVNYTADQKAVSSVTFIPKDSTIVIKPTGPISPYVLFPTITTPPPPNASPDNDSYPSISPEIYPRPADALFSTDTIYSASGDDYDVPLPASTASVAVDERRCADLWTALRGFVAGDRIGQDGSVVVRQQACYKPQIRRHDDGEEVGPMVGAVPGVRGYWLATGHDEWGVSNAAGTGLVVSEMVFEEGGKAKSADCEALDPRHFLVEGVNEDEA